MKTVTILTTFFLILFLAFKPQKQNWTPPAIMLNDCLNLPDEYFNYANIEGPDYMIPILEIQDNEPADNPITDAGATLGRVLFYDKKLSFNDEISYPNECETIVTRTWNTVDDCDMLE